MAEQTIDVKEQVADASTAAAAQATDVQVVKPEGSDSTTVQQGDKQEPTLQEVIKGVLDKHKPDAPTEGKKDEKGEVLKENATKEGEKPAVKKEDAADKKPPVEEDITKYPQRAQERIRALVEEKNTVAAKVKEYEPVVQRMQNVETFCRTNKITPDDFKQTLEIAALIRSNPQEGLKKVVSLVEEMKIALGEGLPQDLQQRVDDGKLDPTDAKALAKARVEEASFKRQRELGAVEQQQTVQRELTSAFQSWDTSKKAADPDFKPKADATLPDGKYELVYQKFQDLWRTVPVNTIMEAAGLLEKAYQSVDATVKSFRPSPPTRRVVTSSKSSTNKNVEQDKIDFSKPGWARKVAALTLEK